MSCDALQQVVGVPNSPEIFEACIVPGGAQPTPPFPHPFEDFDTRCAFTTLFGAALYEEAAGPMFLDARAMYNVGYMLEHGEGGAEVNVPRALGLYRNCTEDPFGGWRVIGWLGRRGVCSLLCTVLWECVRSGFCLSTWDGLVLISSLPLGVFTQNTYLFARVQHFSAQRRDCCLVPSRTRVCGRLPGGTGSTSAAGAAVRATTAIGRRSGMRSGMHSSLAGPRTSFDRVFLLGRCSLPDCAWLDFDFNPPPLRSVGLRVVVVAPDTDRAGEWAAAVVVAVVAAVAVVMGATRLACRGAHLFWVFSRRLPGSTSRI